MRVSDILRTSPYLLIESLKTKNVTSTRTQILDTVHASKLQKTLKHFRLFEDRPLIDGDILPPCFHLIYFNPILAETQLSTDGADKTFNPGEPFTRRMWSGGKMIWVAENPLKLGQSVKEITSLEKVESKRTRDGKTMIVVTGKKDYHNEQGLALSDMRSWLFREPTKEIVPQRAVQPHEILKGTVVGKVKASEVTLFRYSALTFNSHKIHYDRQWCREVEGQNDLVVHGPLNSKSHSVRTQSL